MTSSEPKYLLETSQSRLYASKTSSHFIQDPHTIYIGLGTAMVLLVVNLEKCQGIAGSNYYCTMLSIVCITENIHCSRNCHNILCDSPLCSDGCGRTGTFLTIYSQIERLKTEQVVDVFQWVKSSRIQRAWLVGNQVYITCIHHHSSAIHASISY